MTEKPADILVRRTMQVYEPLYIAISKAATSNRTAMYEFINRILFQSVDVFNRTQTNPDNKIHLSAEDRKALTQLLKQMRANLGVK